jgi:gliding motility-associated-like protein
MKKSILFLLLFLTFCYASGQFISSPSPFIYNLDSNGNQTTSIGNNTSNPIVLGCGNNTYTMEAVFTDIGLTDAYRVESIPFAPQRFLSSNPDGTPIAPVVGQILSGLPDDVWTSIQNLQSNGNNLDFCFFGQQKTQFVASSNGAVSFDISKAGGFSPWQVMNMGKIAPNGDMDRPAIAGLDYNDSILTPFHDTNPANGDAINSSYVFWEIRGTAPNRLFILGTHDMPMFLCGASLGRATHQMVFYETTNIIEFHIQDKPVCDTWVQGFAGLGIQNAASTVGYTAPGRDNLELWQIVSDPVNNPFDNTYPALPVESWRFIPDGGNNTNRPTFAWLDENNVVISTNPILTVDIANFSAATVTYNAQLTYTDPCDGTQVIVVTPVTFTVDDPIRGFIKEQNSADDTVEFIDEEIVNLCENDSYLLEALVYDVDLSDGSVLLYEWTQVTVGVVGNASTLNVPAPNAAVTQIYDLIVTHTEADGVTPRCTFGDRVTLVFATDDATFNYSTNAFCTTDADPTPLNILYPGGTFTINNGGVIDAVTGVIDIVGSGLGTDNSGNFTVNYSTFPINAACGDDHNVNITITGAATTFSYDATYCLTTSTDPTPNFTGDPGGTYTIDNAAIIDATTGVVDITSLAGGTTYAVTYTLGGACPGAETHTFDVEANPDASFNFPTNTACISDGNITAIITGNTGGAFTIDNGATIGSNSGTIDVSTVVGGTTYTIEYTTVGCVTSHQEMVTFIATPTPDAPTDVIACDSYTLPALTGGNYFTATNGGGSALNAGDVINSTQTIFVYAESATTPNCTDENSFTVTINTTPTADAPVDITICDSYTLPALAVGNYFTATNGGGTALNAGDAITSTQTIFVYAETATTPNCTDENSFTVTINTTPTADAPTDVTVCDSYTLPALTIGNYFTATNGGGTALSAGDAIVSTQTIFVYAETATTPNCTDENSFTVTINTSPTVDVIGNVVDCFSYTLPALTVGNYFTATNGGGTALFAGDVINSTQTLFIYAETGTTPNCSDESSFSISIGNPVADNPANLAICDSYTLPPLGVGNYFTATNGGGTALFAGDAISTTQTIFVYAVDGTGACSDENSFTITILNSPTADAPIDVTMCDTYSLPALTVGNYFTATNGGGTALFAGDAITSTQTIFVYAETTTTPNCTDENSFVVTINITPTADAPTNVIACDTYTLPALTVGNYFTATNGGGTALNAGDAITTSQTIFVYAETATTPNCTNENSFTITINTTPTADAPVDVTMCDTYTLPALTVGNYFTATNGGGAALFAGDAITSTQTIFVYAETATTPNCTDENSFIVTINNTPTADVPIDVTVCDTYTLPALTVGNYFTAANGGGTALNAGDAITSTQTIFVYAETATTPNCTNENSFTVTIIVSPTADTPTDVTACDTYTLPALTVGNYFTATNGGGLTMNAGDAITTSQTIFVYAETATTPNCTDENSFTVTINTTPTADAPIDVTVCDTYTLPALTVGNYFTATNGGGTALNAGDPITSTQTIFVYAETATTPNCTNENSFTVTIIVSPTADAPTDVTACDTYTLPALTVGNYYTATNGGGLTMNAGDAITTSQTIFIYAETATTPNCTDENSFTVTINTTPTADDPIDVTVCDSYSLPALTVGNYFTATNGGGTALNAGDPITSTQTVFVYAETATTPNCTDENSFVVTINDTPIVDTPTDVTACDTYTLPALSVGNYFTATNGTGTALFAGDAIISTQTLYIYAETTTTPNCFNESSFGITILPAPTADAPAVVTECVTYTLPSLTVGNYFTATNGGGTALFAGDTITSTQTLYVYAETATTPNCTDENSFVVNILPPDDSNVQYPEAFICKPDCSSGLTSVFPSNFGLAGGTFTINNGGTITANTGEFDLCSTTINTTYTISYLTNGPCPQTSTFDITINEPLDASFNYSITSICENDSNNPIPIITGDLGGEFTIDNGATINSSTGEISMNTTFANTIYTISYELVATATNACSDIKSTTINVIGLPEFELPVEAFICPNMTDTTISVLNSLGSYDYEWFNTSDNTSLGFGDSIIVTDVGIYAVTASDNSNPSACTSTQLISVGLATQAEIEDVFVADFNRPDNTITISVVGGSGDFSYSIDGGATFQDSNTFERLLANVYDVVVTDNTGCSEDIIQSDVVVLDYPRFFTPNGDTENDTWQITGANLIPDSKIFIFDRFGKVLAQLDPTSVVGWDGVYLGKQVPATDYWFTAQYRDPNNNLPRSVNGHFSIVRK